MVRTAAEAMAREFAKADILLEAKNRAEHERRMVEVCEYDLTAEYISEARKQTSRDSMLKHKQKAEILEALCEMLVNGIFDPE